MKVLRDYCCEKCGTIQERYIESQVVTVDCACGAIANRIVGTPHVSLDGTDPGFPGAYEKWARVREEHARMKGRRNN